MSRPEPRPASWRGFPLRTCRICGCDDLHACPHGCYWIADDLCSACLNLADLEDDAPIAGVIITLAGLATLAGLFAALIFFALNHGHLATGGLHG